MMHPADMQTGSSGARVPGRCALLAMCLVVTSCAVGPDFVRPAAPQVHDYTADAQAATLIGGAGITQTLLRGAQPDVEWWRSFQSPDIDDMVERAMQGNPTLASAEASLRQSQDNLRAGYGAFFPQADLGVGGTREHSAPALNGLPGPGSIFNVFTLSGGIVYAIDLFGGQRRIVEGLSARSDNARFEAAAARLALQANVVDAAIARAVLATQLKSTEKIVRMQNEALEQSALQVRAGVLNDASLVALRGQLAQTEDQLALLWQNFDQSGQLLTNLQGEFAANLKLPEMDLTMLTLPTDLPVSLPSDLVHRRPDILAAEANLHAASADVGVATASLFPAVSLSANAGVAGNSVHDLHGENAKFWNGGAAASVPVFRGGSLWYGRKAAMDAYEASAQNYRQTVLDAFSQVGNVLKALEHDAQAVEAERALLDASLEASQVAHVNYQAGLISWVDLLSAEIQVEQNAMTFAAAVGQRYQDTVALFAATGGGWQGDSPALPVSADSGSKP